MSDNGLVISGINGATGEYSLGSITSNQLSRVAQGETFDEEELRELEWWAEYSRSFRFGPKEGVDPKDLAQAGWGVIFEAGADPALRDALKPLLELRREQAAGRNESLYKEYTGHRAYRPGESKQQFLSRQGVGPGPADPDKVPYYLLIVGSPTGIPFPFQYQLDVQYAVGRIHFESLEEYACYAESVVRAEKLAGRQSWPRPKEIAFFAPANQDDRATQGSCRKMAGPLAGNLNRTGDNWTIRKVMAEDALKSNLAELLGGGKTPSLLFTASHGLAYPKDHAWQRDRQGALMCQDWPGPRHWKGGIDRGHYFCAEDLPQNADLHGLIAFHFNCYGAGTPQWDDFAARVSGQRKLVAPAAFVSRMGQRLLGHAKGGALAVVAHVERAWGFSFEWPKAGVQLQAFEDTLTRLVEGHPVGSAMEPLNLRYAELSTDLNAVLEDIRYGKEPNDLELGDMWTAHNDARNYVVLGDPAVRMPWTRNGMNPTPLP